MAAAAFLEMFAIVLFLGEIKIRISMPEENMKKIKLVSVCVIRGNLLELICIMFLWENFTESTESSL